MSRRVVHLLIVLALAGPQWLALGGVEVVRDSAKADGRAQIAIRAHGAHVVSQLRLKDVGVGLVSWALSHRGVIVGPPGISTNRAAPEVPRFWGTGGAASIDSRPPPLA